jgi:hypothetical protein
MRVCNSLGEFRMRWTVLAVLCLAACNTTTGTDGGTPSSDGGTTDYAPPYVANWMVTGDLTADGQDVPQQFTMPVQEVSPNVIELQQFCSDNDIYSDGPVADVTATGFTIRSGSCSYSSVNCSDGDLEVSWASGSGSLSNDVLSATCSGEESCAGLSTAYTVTLTSTSKGTYGSVTAHRGTGLAEGLRMLKK